MPNLTARNTEAFVYARTLQAEAAAYDLMQGTIRAQMRRSADAPLVYLEWSTGAGNLTRDLVQAAGFVAFTKNPAAGSTLTVGETVVTFVAANPGPLGILLEADLDATLVNAVAKLSGSTDPDLAAHTYAATDSRLDLVAKASGPEGNLMALATDVEGASVSADTLLGGGVRVTLSAPVEAVSRFLGAYAYDVSFDDATPGTPAWLFGGTLTFVPGITRR